MTVYLGFGLWIVFYFLIILVSNVTVNQKKTLKRTNFSQTQ